jgi:hypothetical protein
MVHAGAEYEGRQAGHDRIPADRWKEADECFPHQFEPFARYRSTRGRRLCAIVMIPTRCTASPSAHPKIICDTVRATKLRQLEWFMLAAGTADADCRCR